MTVENAIKGSESGLSEADEVTRKKLLYQLGKALFARSLFMWWTDEGFSDIFAWKKAKTTLLNIYSEKSGEPSGVRGNNKIH